MSTWFTEEDYEAIISQNTFTCHRQSLGLSPPGEREVRATGHLRAPPQGQRPRTSPRSFPERLEPRQPPEANSPEEGILTLPFLSRTGSSLSPPSANMGRFGPHNSDSSIKLTTLGSRHSYVQGTLESSEVRAGCWIYSFHFPFIC